MDKLPIKEYSLKYDIPIDTLRWQVKNEKIPFVKEKGKIYILVEGSKKLENEKSDLFIKELKRQIYESKLKIKELENKLEQKNSKIENLLISQKNEIEKINKNSWETLNNFINTLNNSNILKNSYKDDVLKEEESPKEDVSIIEVRDDNSLDSDYYTKRKDDFISLKEYLESRDLKSQKDYDKIRKRVSKMFKDEDIRVVKIKGRFYIDKTSDILND